MKTHKWDAIRAKLPAARRKRVDAMVRREIHEIKSAEWQEGFQAGAEAAAEIADGYNASTTHEYQLGDCILCKLNLTKRKKPRRNSKRIRR